MKFKKYGIIIAFVVMALLLLSGCGCEHEFGKWATVKPATCDSKGSEERVCSKCEEKETREIKTLPHEFDEWSVAAEPTCAEVGIEKRSCTVCGTSEEKEIAKLVEHTYGDWIIVIEPDCTEEGSREQTCVYCEDINTEAVAANGHKWVEATCTAPKTCSVCNDTEGDVTEHSWIEATCTEPKTCSVCNVTEGDAVGHSWIDATCTAAKTCSVCYVTDGYPLGHNWSAATCDSPKTCYVCSATEGVALSHSANSNGTCNNCGKTMTAEDYSYLAGNDFRSIRRQYINAEAIGAYVIKYTDMNGDLCVLTYVRYKIISSYSQTTLHNLSTGKTYTDAVNYYNKVAQTYWGNSKIHYMKLANEVLGKEAEALEELTSAIKNGSHSGVGAYVSPSTLNL